MMALLNVFDGIGLSLSHTFEFFMSVTFGYLGTWVCLLILCVECFSLWFSESQAEPE